MRDCKPAMLVQQGIFFWDSDSGATLHFAKSAINTTSKKIPYRIVAASGGPGIRMAAFVMEASLHDVAPGSARHDIFWWKFLQTFQVPLFGVSSWGLKNCKNLGFIHQLYKPFLLHIFIISSMYYVCIFYLWYIHLVSVYDVYIYATYNTCKKNNNQTPFRKKNPTSHPKTKPRHAGLRGAIALVLCWELGDWVDELEGAGTKETLVTSTLERTLGGKGKSDGWKVRERWGGGWAMREWG